MDWDDIYEYCIDADIIIDAKIAEAIVWQGMVSPYIDFMCITFQIFLWPNFH